MKRAAIFILCSIMCVTVMARTFLHPGITYTMADIQRMRVLTDAQVEPYYGAFTSLISSSYVTRAAGTNKPTTNDNVGLGGRCALDNALLYHITGITAYATKAIAWINNYSYIESVTSGTTALDGGKVVLLVEAAELMRDYPGWAEADKTRFSNMLRNVHFHACKNFDRGRWGNQGLNAARALMAMAIYLDEEGWYDHVYRYLTAQSRNTATDQTPYPLGPPTQRSQQSSTDCLITYTPPSVYGNDECIFDEALPYYIFDNGQCEESSRDQGHSQFGLNVFGNIAEMAWNQGDNLYGELDNRILLGFEWTYRYNLDSSWEPTGYITDDSDATFDNGKYYRRMTRSKRWYSLRPYATDRGADYSCGLNREMVLAHYSVRAALPKEKYKYLRQSVDRLISNYGCEKGDMATGGHFYEFPGWGTLTKRRGEWQVGDPVRNGVFYLPKTNERIRAADYDHTLLQEKTNKGITTADGNITSIDAAGWACYTFSVSRQGEYTVELTYDTSEDQELAVAIDGSEYATGTLPSSKKIINIGTFNLTAGIHVMRIKSTSNMKRIFTLITAAVIATAASANEVVLNSIAEYQFRTNGSTDPLQTLVEPTGWTINQSGSERDNIECTYSARMWGQEMFDVTDVNLSSATSVTLTFNMANTTSYRLGAWIYPDADWTTEEQRTWTDGTCPVVEKFKSVIGVLPGYVASANNYVVRYEGASNAAVQTLEFTGDALSKLKAGVVEKDGKKYISFIITFNEVKASYGTGRNPKYYSIKNADKQVTMTVVSEQAAIVNNATGTGYSTVEAALSEVSQGETASFTINKDLTIKARVNVQDKDITFIGATGTERFLRDPGYKGLLFLTVKPSDKGDGTSYTSSITFQNIIIDGQNIECTGSTIESSNNGTMTFNDVTFQNCINTTGTQGILCNKGNGITNINGVKMKDCSSASSKAPLFIGTNYVSISGSNDFGAVFIEKNGYITNKGITGTLAIVVDNSRADNVVLVKNGKVEDYTVSGQPSGYELYQKDNDVFLGTDVSTAIKEIEDKSTLRSKAYNLSGHRIDGNTKGIVIIEGKKYIVK